MHTFRQAAMKNIGNHSATLSTLAFYLMFFIWINKWEASARKRWRPLRCSAHFNPAANYYITGFKKINVI